MGRLATSHETTSFPRVGQNKRSKRTSMQETETEAADWALLVDAGSESAVLAANNVIEGGSDQQHELLIFLRSSWSTLLYLTLPPM